MRLAHLSVFLAGVFLAGCATAPESSLLVEKRREAAHDQLVQNLHTIADENISAREHETFQRLVAETKISILLAAKTSNEQFSPAYVMGVVETFQRNVRKVMSVINAERAVLGRAKVDDLVYKQLTAEIFSYLSTLGQITPDQVKAFASGLSEGGEDLLKDLEAARKEAAEERKRQAELEAAIEASREEE